MMLLVISILLNWGRKSDTLRCFRNEALLGKFLSKWKRSFPITGHITIHHILQGQIMTPNSLDSSTVFAYHNEPTTIPEALCTSGRQKSSHNGPWSNGSWRACATSVWSSPCDTGYVLLLHIHRPKSFNDINKELTMSSNHGLLYIYKSLSPSSSRLSPTRSLNGAWSAYVLSVWGCYGGPPGAPDQPPVTFTNWCPWPKYHACCHPVPPDGQRSIVDRYWGSSNCFPIDLRSQLVTDPW